jgi:hypothetical protein
LYSQKNHLLSSEQKIFFEQHFDFLPKDISYPKEEKLPEVLHKKISIETAKDLFQKIFLYYGLEKDWSIEQKDEFKNFSVNFSQKTLCIP